MASDGCLEVAWKGQAFPYLMHHPADPSRSESYGTAREEAKAHPSEPATRKVAAGVWNGRAPHGFLAANEQGKTITPAAQPLKIPRHAIVGQLRMPMLVLDTAGMSGANLASALTTGFCGLLCSTGNSNLSDIGTAISQFSVDNNSLFITVKVPSDTAAQDAASAVKTTLSALGIQKVDLVVMEVSSATSGVWAALEGLVDASSIRALGLLGATLEQACEVVEGCRVRPVANFMELHPMRSERKAVGQLLRKGLQAVAMLPTGGAAGAPMLQHDTVTQVAQEAGHSASEVLLKWSTQRGTPVVVDPVTTALEGWDVADFFKWKLSEEKHKVLLDAMNEYKSFA